MTTAAVTDIPSVLDISTGLFGICSIVQEQSNNTGVVILNSGILHRVGPYRLHVTLARKLASAGFPTIRLDQSGKGDSEPRVNTSRADTISDEIRATSGFLAEQYGVSKIVLIGLCSGADDILNHSHHCSNLAGVVLLDGYAQRNLSYFYHRYAPKLLSVQGWIDRISSVPSDTGEVIGQSMGVNIREWDDPKAIVKRYAELDQTGVNNLSIFTTDASDYYCYEGQLKDNIAAIGKTPVNLTELFVSQAKHLYPIQSHRNDLVNRIFDWMQKHHD